MTLNDDDLVECSYQATDALAIVDYYDEIPWWVLASMLWRNPFLMNLQCELVEVSGPCCNHDRIFETVA